MLEPFCWRKTRHPGWRFPKVSFPKSIPTMNLRSFCRFWRYFMAQNCGADNFKQRKAVRQSGQVYVMTILKKCLVPNMSCFTWGLYPQVPVSPSSLKMPIRTPTKRDFCLISSERKGWKPQKWGQTGTMPRHSNYSLGRFQQKVMTGAFVALGQSFREAMFVPGCWGLKTETCYVVCPGDMIGNGFGIWRHASRWESWNQGTLREKCMWRHGNAWRVGVWGQDWLIIMLGFMATPCSDKPKYCINPSILNPYHIPLYIYM